VELWALQKTSLGVGCRIKHKQLFMSLETQEGSFLGLTEL
jgi:hypothetical protein